MKYKQGDILTNDNGRRKVFGVCGEVYFMSYESKDTKGKIFNELSGGYTQYDLDKGGYKLYTPPEAGKQLSYKPFSPKEEEIYFYVGTWGHVLSGTYYSNANKWNAESGNCFRTEEEAEYYRDWLIARKRIMDSSDFEIAWENPKQDKWAIYYDHRTKRLGVVYWCYNQYNSLPPYKSEKEAEQATQDLENEYLVYFGIKRSLNE